MEGSGSPDETLRPGSVVERYEVVRPLGEGGMARVWLVRHTTLGTLHALKVLRLTGPTLRARFLEEGRAQSSLRHENVVRVSDVLDIEGLPALILDYVDGPDLAAWIVEHEPDPATAEEVFRGILAGVGAAHATGRVHRDLKPANVLMARGADGRFVPKVADFGLAKLVEGDPDRGFATRQGLPMGTPRYMAPEQIRDGSKADFRSDIFSLGAILHELLTHEPAFLGEDLLDIFEAVKSGNRSTVPDVVPARLRAVVDRCLQTDPADRPADVPALLALLDGAPAAPLPPKRAPAPPRRPGGAAAFSATVLAVALAAAGAGTVLVALAVALLFRLLDGASPTDPCGDGVTGVVTAPTVFGKRAGERWLLRVDTQVYAEVPPEGAVAEPVCVLRRGTWLTLGEDPVPANGARWVAVRPEYLAPAAPEDLAPDGAAPGPCPTAPSGELVGWYPVRPQLFGGRPRQGSTWTSREDKEVVREVPPPGAAPSEVVCVIPGGTRVKVLQAPQVDGATWWVPYVIP